ncbi:hypothetical protein [Microseira wollei]|uniref:hypothetical protein n=1 Tax=Microseira wollei TaxID=467598 RepID=UPI001CFD1025|nr:hypothetical protein [Microseira wollei]
MLETRRSLLETKIALAQAQFSLLGLKKLAQNERSPLLQIWGRSLIRKNGFETPSFEDGLTW